MTSLLIYGASGHGKVIADAARANGWEVVGFCDDDPSKLGTFVGDTPIIASNAEDACRLARERSSLLIVGIGDNAARRALYRTIKQFGGRFATIIHPHATLAPNSTLGEGSVVFAGVVVNADARIGCNVILNTSATVDHDCQIGDHAHISPGAHVGGAVEIGEGAWVGIGASIRNNLALGDWTTIGAGAVVVSPIPDRVMAYGVPAKAHSAWHEGAVEARWVQPGDAEWEDALRQCPHDVYHTSEYVLLEARRMHGEAGAVLLKADGLIGLIPLVVRRLPSHLGSEFDRFRDATSPYGYPGPIFGGADGARSAKLPEALHMMRQLLAGRGVCTVFLRLHTLLPAPEIEESPNVHVVNHGETVWMDLTLDEAGYRRTLRENHRRVLRRLEAQGITAHIDARWERLNDFIALYYETMEDTGATADYFFSPQYFFDLRDALGSRAVLVLVTSGQEVLSGGIFFTVGGIMNYHLGGTFRRHRDLAPSRVMFDFMRRWGAERGDRQLHLGGGVGGAEGDSLFQFKAGFSPLRSPFRTWRLVTLPEVYDAAVERWRASAKSSDVSAFFPLYRREP